MEYGNVFIFKEYLLVLVSFDNRLLGEDFTDLMQAQVVKLVLRQLIFELVEVYAL